MDDSVNFQLPATVPTAAIVLQRTQTTLGLLRDVVQESSAKAWFERGIAAEANTQWPEAAYAYRQCVERDAQFWRAGVRLGAALAHLAAATVSASGFARALGQVEAAATALTGVHEVAFIVWGELVKELDTSTWKLLRNCLEAARSTAQDGFQLLLGLVLAYVALEQKEEARRTLEEMRFMYGRQVEKSVLWFRISALFYFKSGLYSEVNTACDYLLEFEPNDCAAYYYRGAAKCFLQDYVGAIVDQSHVIALKPNFGLAESYYRMGSAKNGLKDYVGAICDYDYAIELMPDFFPAYTDRGNVKQTLQDYVGALADHDRVIELRPYDANAYYNRGNDKTKLQDYAGAIADYDFAIKFNSGHISAYCNRALVKEKIGDTAGAVADRQKAAQLEAGTETN